MDLVFDWAMVIGGIGTACGLMAVAAQRLAKQEPIVRVVRCRACGGLMDAPTAHCAADGHFYHPYPCDRDAA